VVGEVRRPRTCAALWRVRLWTVDIGRATIEVRLYDRLAFVANMLDLSILSRKGARDEPCRMNRDCGDER
jgi:hypothetical protein